MPALIDVIEGRTGRGAPALAARGRARRRLALLPPANSRPAPGRCSACGAMPAPCTWRCSTSARRDRGRHHRLPATARYPSVGALHPPAIRLERAMRDLYRPRAGRPAGPAALARSRILGRRRIRSAAPGRQPQDRVSLMPSCRSKARTCIRSRSAPCTPASSSPDRLPLHRQRRDGGAPRSSASAMRTRASNPLMTGAFARKSRPARRPHLGRQHGRLCARPSRVRSRPRSAARSRAGGGAGRAKSARTDGRARAPRQSSRRHRRDLQ